MLTIVNIGVKLYKIIDLTFFTSLAVFMSSLIIYLVSDKILLTLDLVPNSMINNTSINLGSLVKHLFSDNPNSSHPQGLDSSAGSNSTVNNNLSNNDTSSTTTSVASNIFGIFTQKYGTGFNSLTEAIIKMETLNYYNFKNSLSPQETEHLEFETNKIWTWYALKIFEKEAIWAREGLSDEVIMDRITEHAERLRSRTNLKSRSILENLPVAQNTELESKLYTFVAALNR